MNPKGYLLLIPLAFGIFYFYLYPYSHSRHALPTPPATNPHIAPNANPLAKAKTTVMAADKPVPSPVTLPNRQNSQPEPQPGQPQEDSFRAAMMQNNLQGAQKALDEMARMPVKSRFYYENRPPFFMKLGNTNEARSALQECVTAIPNSQLCLVGRMSLEMKDGSLRDQDKAIADCLAVAPDNSLCRDGRAQLLAKNGQGTAAVAIYQELLAKQGGDRNNQLAVPYLEMKMADALEAAGDLAQAMSYRRQSCQDGNPIACRQLQTRNTTSN